MFWKEKIMSKKYQKVFDKVATHLMEQGVAAVDKNNSCKYRTGDGLKCAVGCLIPDNKYTPRLEGGNASHNIETHGMRIDGVWFYTYEFKEFLNSLQMVHDLRMPLPEGTEDHGFSDRTMDYWKGGMRQIASRYDLDASILDGEK